MTNAELINRIAFIALHLASAGVIYIGVLLACLNGTGIGRAPGIAIPLTAGILVLYQVCFLSWTLRKGLLDRWKATAIVALPAAVVLALVFAL